MKQIAWVTTLFALTSFLYFALVSEKEIQIMASSAEKGADTEHGGDINGASEADDVALIQDAANLKKETNGGLPLVSSENIKRIETANANLAYEYFRRGDSYAALQILEKSRWDSLENFGLFGDIKSLCTFSRDTAAKSEERVAELRKQSGPRTESAIWQLEFGYQFCKGFKAAPVDEKAAFARVQELHAARRRREEAEAVTPDQRRNWFDKQVTEASDPAKLWDLIRSDSFQGAVGGEYFGVAPDSVRSDTSSSQRLSRAQSVAIMRLRCDMTQSCGPNQVDSLLLCSRFSQCRPGVTVNSVWQNVAAPYELQAADAIYREYVLRRAQRGG